MEDQNNNGIPDHVEIKTHEADATKAKADAEKAKLDLERARLPYQVPLYDRVVMRLVVPFTLAFAAPVATYYFGSKVESNSATIDRLEKTADRLERLAVQAEMRRRIRAMPTPPTVAHVVSSSRPTLTLEQLAERFIQQQEQETPTDLDRFLQDQDQSQLQQQVQEQRNASD